MKLISISEAAEILGVSVSTMRRWDREGKLSPTTRTIGNHRRYILKNILAIANPDTQTQAKTVCYARVSSHDQKQDLDRQSKTLELYCRTKNIQNFEIIEDLGSGLNFKKKGLKKLVKMIINGEINRIILTHKDRLLRFGSDLLINIAKEFGIETTILNQVEKSFEEELSQDIIEIITVFSAKLYGKRSHQNKKRLTKT